MYQERLRMIIAKAREFGLPIPPGCPATEVRRLNRLAEERLGRRLPEPYLAFLTEINGLDVDGLAILCADDVGEDDIPSVVDTNTALRDENGYERFAVLATSGDIIYGFDYTDLVYCTLDKISLDRLEAFATFEAMLLKALEGRMGVL